MVKHVKLKMLILHKKFDNGTYSTLKHPAFSTCTVEMVADFLAIVQKSDIWGLIFILNYQFDPVFLMFWWFIFLCQIPKINGL